MTARRTALAVVAAMAMMFAGASSCAPPPGGGGPALPCARTALTPTATPIGSTGVVAPSVPPGVDLGFAARAVAEEVSDNGVIHVWVVGELQDVALGTSVVKRLHVYAQDTTTGEAPELVYQVHKWAGLFGPRLVTDTDGWPTIANVDAISFDGTGARISVTYGTLHSLFMDLAFVGEPSESYVHHISCA